MAVHVQIDLGNSHGLVTVYDITSSFRVERIRLTATGQAYTGFWEPGERILVREVRDHASGPPEVIERTYDVTAEGARLDV